MNQETCYSGETIKLIEELHAPIYRDDWADRPIQETLRLHAANLLRGLREGNPGAAAEVAHSYPPLLDRDEETIQKASFRLDNALLTVAIQHGFRCWQDVEELGNERPDPLFELAADHLIHGEYDALRELLIEEDYLIYSRSRFGHRAPLLHYIAANGVELRRQKIPYNAVSLAGLLVGRGADINSTIYIYRGHHTALSLLNTSAAAEEAGLVEELAKFFNSHGSR